MIFTYYLYGLLRVLAGPSSSETGVALGMDAWSQLPDSKDPLDRHQSDIDATLSHKIDV